MSYTNDNFTIDKCSATASISPQYMNLSLDRINTTTPELQYANSSSTPVTVASSVSSDEECSSSPSSLDTSVDSLSLEEKVEVPSTPATESCSTPLKDGAPVYAHEATIAQDIDSAKHEELPQPTADALPTVSLEM